MTASERERRLIVRYRNGTPNHVEPDLDQRLAEIVSAIKAGSSPRDLAKRTTDGARQLLDSSSVWAQVVTELFSRFERHNNPGRDWVGPLVSVLDVLAADSGPSECWLQTRAAILDDMDVLSAWDQTGFARDSFPSNIQREGDQYFEMIDGERVQVIGTRTTTEIRWDFIRDAAYNQYSPLNGILRCVALRNICRDFREHPEHYPPSIQLAFSEDQNGSTAFLHYDWHIPWPYGMRTLSWRPNCNPGDREYLANDLVAAFADREQIPERDRIPASVPCDELTFNEKTKDYPTQLDLALETQMVFGEHAEVWFDFHNRPIRWINQTPYMLTTLVVPTKGKDDDDSAYRLALEFLSSLVFTHRVAVKVFTSARCGRRPLPFLQQPHKPVGLLVADTTTPIVSCASGSPKALGIALFAEATNSGSVYYSFLSYWKVLELAHTGDKKKLLNWINANLTRLPLLDPRFDYFRADRQRNRLRQRHRASPKCV